MRGTASIKMERYRYGAASLWAIRGHLCGSAARRIEQLVDLFFRGDAGDLIIDLREAGFIDSAGARALTRCRGEHPDVRLVGFPPAWDDLSLDVRVALLRLDPAHDLAEALLRSFDVPRGTPELRRHARIPVQIPVELCCAGNSAMVSLSDISRGGVRFAGVPEGLLPALRLADPLVPCEILGLEADPLGSELTGRDGQRAVAAIPVHFFPGAGLGARFLESHPPV
jgi:hypothetical protein